MKKCLIYEDINGECKIIVPNSDFKQAWESEQNAIGRLYEVSLPPVFEILVCEIEKIPKDLTFRNAWKKGDVQEPIKIDLEIAKEIHRVRIKHTSLKKIEELNQQLEIAIEKDNLPEQVAINKTKQILRKLHECDLSHCKTVEDIKYSIPQELHNLWIYYDPADPRKVILK